MRGYIVVVCIEGMTLARLGGAPSTASERCDAVKEAVETSLQMMLGEHAREIAVVSVSEAEVVELERFEEPERFTHGSLDDPARRN